MSWPGSEWVAWLMLPLSGNTVHDLSAVASWHGRIMVLCWGVLLPLGVMVARFFKVMPGQAWPQELDNKRWWKIHLHGQGWSVVLAWVGVFLIWGHAQAATASAQWHGRLGWGVMGLACLQVVVGWMRGSKGGPTQAVMRGDHYDMTPWRNAFERVHKSMGYLALLCAVGALSMGLWVADAPRWMVILLGGWWLVMAVAFGVLQAQGRCMDTYQAIWGPDELHPGNQKKPIGWGIARYTEGSFQTTFRANEEKS